MFVLDLCYMRRITCATREVKSVFKGAQCVQRAGLCWGLHLNPDWGILASQSRPMTDWTWKRAGVADGFMAFASARERKKATLDGRAGFWAFLCANTLVPATPGGPNTYAQRTPKLPPLFFFLTDVNL